MWSCPGNMPKYYPGLRDILPDPGNMPKYYPGLRDKLPDPRGNMSPTWVIFWHIAWTRPH